MNRRYTPTKRAIKRFTFRRGKLSSGRMRLAPSYRVAYQGDAIATIQCKDKFAEADSMWFWYGDGVNTAHDPKPLDACKKEIMDHFKRLFAIS